MSPDRQKNFQNKLKEGDLDGAAQLLQKHAKPATKARMRHVLSLMTDKISDPQQRNEYKALLKYAKGLAGYSQVANHVIANVTSASDDVYNVHLKSLQEAVQTNKSIHDPDLFPQEKLSYQKGIQTFFAKGKKAVQEIEEQKEGSQKSKRNIGPRGP